MTLKENIVTRLVGLFIFFAPNAGVNFLFDVYLALNRRLGRPAA